MKLLLDESLPRRLTSTFPESFTIRTVQEMGWAGTRNGLLLQLAAAQGFDALVTVDRGFEHQQNIGNLPISVIIILAHGNRIVDLEPLVPDVARLSLDPSENRIYRVGFEA